MKLKKIKLVIFHPYSSIGGADKSISRLINGLNDRKYEIIFITLNKAYIKNYLTKKIRIIEVKSSKAIFSIFKIRKILNKILKTEKIIFLSNQNFANIISFFILYKMNNIKQVIVERNHIDELSFDKGIYDRLKKKLIKNLMILFYRKADGIIGNAKKLSVDLASLTNAKVKTIYNPAFDKDIFKNKNEKIKLYRNKKIILNIGRLENQKDQITILKAIKNIDDILLIIIGFGSLKKKLSNYIKHENLKEKVIILENVSNPYPYFKIANLFVLSSLYEGFPNVLTEAIMFGVPIITSNCNSGPAEILLKKKGPQFFNKGDHRQLTFKIKSFFKNQKIISKRKKYLIKMLGRFQKDKIIKEYDEFFNNLFN
tara:strand:+ start:436 stop:1545 length:1110 start_codon:yes stop_codon:yes gene_type:complete